MQMLVLGVGSAAVPASLPPSWHCRGDLAGTYPNPGVLYGEDNLFTIVNSIDKTKAIGWNLTGATTATTLTIASAQTASHTLTIPVLAGNDKLAVVGLDNGFTSSQTISVAW